MTFPQNDEERDPKSHFIQARLRGAQEDSGIINNTRVEKEHYGHRGLHLRV